MKKTEFKILCSSHQACPDVMSKLKELNFEAIIDTPESSFSDISASKNISDENEMRALATKIFNECKGKVKQIQIRSV